MYNIFLIICDCLSFLLLIIFERPLSNLKNKYIEKYPVPAPGSNHLEFLFVKYIFR